jgi:hypothetical protein
VDKVEGQVPSAADLLTPVNQKFFLLLISCPIEAGTASTRYKARAARRDREIVHRLYFMTLRWKKLTTPDYGRGRLLDEFGISIELLVSERRWRQHGIC